MIEESKECFHYGSTLIFSFAFSIFPEIKISYLFQVQNVQEDAAKLLVAYSGDKAREIQDREAEVVNAWRNLQINMEYRKNLLVDTADLFKFFSLVRDLMLWMEDMVRQMTTQEKPRYNYFYCWKHRKRHLKKYVFARFLYQFQGKIAMHNCSNSFRDVSGVELLMNNHQSLKAEIDAREENFAICVNLGRDLLARKHYRSPEVNKLYISFVLLPLVYHFLFDVL